MSLQTDVEQQLKEAMKAKEAVRVKALRQIKSELLKLQTSGREYSEQDEKAMLKRLVKQHNESIEAFQGAGRAEQAEEERQELEIIQTFLPPQLSGAELEAAVKQAVSETGASSPKDMGKVMKHLKSAGVEADGREMSEMVKNVLGA